MIQWNKITQVTLLLPIFITLLPTAQSQLGASFQESCGDDDILCDPSALLSCINSSCDCIKPKGMRFDDAKKKCVVISGEKCDYGQQQGRLDCVKNAFCNETGHCECHNKKHSYDEQFFGTKEGTCVPRGVVGDNCTSEIGCREDLLLSCENGLCACNSTIGILDKLAGKCAVRAGSPCMAANFNGMKCVTKSYCDSDYYRPVQEYACICESGYLHSHDGTCLPSHEARCQSNNPCHEEFVCIDGICKCPFSLHQYFNSTAGKCVSYARGPCSRIVGGVQYTYPCANNAECNTSVGEGALECSCKPGWIESKMRSCRLSHDQPCSNELIGKGHHGCDPIGGLVCINDKCSCPGLQVYDEKESKCRGDVGAVCSPTQVGFCMDGTDCTKFRGDDLGVCQG